jgi:DNA primase
VVIPIQDPRGRIIAFGGRAFGSNQPKYLNTRETPLFSKGNVLFGFHRAKGQLRDGALVVEGYFDVLQLHQQGLPQAVAPLGTALTEGHLQQIGRFTKRVILCFDGDAAGLRAMEKGLKLALPLGFDVRLLLLPQGEDPDTWCLALGAEAFRELIRKAPDWTNFIIDRAMEGKDLNRIPDRMAAFQELAGYLAFLAPSVDQRGLFASLAHWLGVPLSELDLAVKARAEAAVRAQAEAAARVPADEEARAHAAGGEAAPPPALPPVGEVDFLLRHLLIQCHDPDVLAKAAAMPPAWWESLKGAPLLQCLLDADGDESLIPAEALARLRGLEASRVEWADADLVPEQVFMRLELAFVEREKQALNRQLQEPGVLVDPRLQGRLAQNLEGLLRRGRQLRVRMADLRRKSFAR